MARRAQMNARKSTFRENIDRGIPRHMPVYKGLAQLPHVPKSSVVTVGNFDGVHKGHREILERVVSRAKELQGTAVAVTFRPHPRAFLHATSVPLINTYEEKVEILLGLGVDWVVEEPFTREFSNISADQFFHQVFCHGLEAKALFLGYDFAFGKGRAGNVDTLTRLAAARGIEAEVVPPYQQEGKAVSSSAIRKFLEEGDVASAKSFLGRAFFLRGLVWRGDGRGRSIGIPTANLRTEFRLYPKNGVYVTTTLWRGKRLPSISNVGVNPTFKGDAQDLPLKVETHLFDWKGDIYGDEISVEFHEFLRPERKFSGAEELKAQIQKDFMDARRILGG
jgi:riboflavin kinase / FMN adenylyltransferase